MKFYYFNTVVEARKFGRWKAANGYDVKVREIKKQTVEMLWGEEVLPPAPYYIYRVEVS